MTPGTIRQALCPDNSFCRAPPFKGNTDPAIGAFLRVNSRIIKNLPITFCYLFIGDYSPFGASVDADATLETSLGNFISHVKLL